MKKRTLQAASVAAILAAGTVYLYPVIGWRCLSDEAQNARLDQWEQEEEALTLAKPTFSQKLLHDIKCWSEFDRSRVLDLGLDSEGGMVMVISIEIDKLYPEKREMYKEIGYSESQIRKDVQQIVLQQFQRRLDDFQVKKPGIHTLGDNRFQIMLSGEKPEREERSRTFVSRTPSVTFHFLAEQDAVAGVFDRLKAAYGDDLKPPFLQVSTDVPSAFFVPAEHYEKIHDILRDAEEKGLIPEDKVIAFGRKPHRDAEQLSPLYVMDKAPFLDTSGLIHAFTEPDRQNPPHFKITFDFCAKYGERMAQATEANMGKYMAIVADGIVCSATVVRERISKHGQIAGNFDKSEARDVAIALNAGSTVVPLKEESTRYVKPIKDRQTTGKIVVATIVGGTVFAILMILYFLTTGLLALRPLLLRGSQFTHAP